MGYSEIRLSQTHHIPYATDALLENIAKRLGNGCIRKTRKSGYRRKDEHNNAQRVTALANELKGIGA